MIFPNSPFQALGFPGEVTDLIRTDGGGSAVSGLFPGRWVDVITVKAVDEFSNSVSNINVSFSITNSGSNGCTPTSPTTPGAVFSNNFS